MDGRWSKPVNVGYPVNTTDDDLFYVPISGSVGYMAKLEDGGYGREDIYKYSYQDDEEEIVPEEETEDLMVETPRQVVGSEATVEEEEIIETEEPKAPPVEKIEINVEPILFGFDSYVLTDKEKHKLEDIIKMMKAEKSITVLISGYADATGGENYNMALTKTRARSVAKYISLEGIESERIRIEAKGATNFVAINKNTDGTDNPRGRKYNRRAELQFFDLSENVSINQMDIVPDELKIK